MKALLKTSPIDQLAINSIHDLQAASMRLEASLKMQEAELRIHLKRLPVEAVKAGVGNAVPSILNSKMAGIAFTAGTTLLGNYLLPKAAASTVGILGSTLKKAGIATIGEMAFKLLFRKKKK